MNNDSDEECCPYITQDGKKQHPIVLDVYLIIIKIVSALIGIPLNVFIAINIIRLCQRFPKPRYIFVLGIIFCDLLAFVPVVIELTYFILPDDSVCRAYVAVVGLPYALLLMNMSFALSDRYIAIKYPLWHRKKMSARFTIGFLVISSLSMIFFLKFVLIFQLVPLRCDARFVHSLIIGGAIVFLFTLCIIINIVVYRQTKTILARSRNLTHLTSNGAIRTKRKKGLPDNELGNGKFEPIDCQQVTIGMSNIVGNDDQNTIVASAVKEVPSSGLSIHVDNETTSQIELKATHTLIAGVTSLFAMACPLILLLFSIHFCRIITGYPAECKYFLWVGPYLRELGLIHAAIYNPLMWLVRNDEFRLVLKSN